MFLNIFTHPNFLINLISNTYANARPLNYPELHDNLEDALYPYF